MYLQVLLTDLNSNDGWRSRSNQFCLINQCMRLVFDDFVILCIWRSVSLSANMYVCLQVGRSECKFVCLSERLSVFCPSVRPPYYVYLFLALSVCFVLPAFLKSVYLLLLVCVPVCRYKCLLFSQMSVCCTTAFCVSISLLQICLPDACLSTPLSVILSAYL